MTHHIVCDGFMLEDVATNLHHDKLDITIYIYLEIIFRSNRQSIMNLHLFYLKKNWLICKKIHSLIFMVLLSKKKKVIQYNSTLYNTIQQSRKWTLSCILILIAIVSQLKPGLITR